MGFIGLEVIYLQKHLPGSNSGPRSNWKRNVTCKLWILSLSLMIPHYPGNSYCAYELFFSKIVKWMAYRLIHAKV